jgi:hypothetical protein
VRFLPDIQAFADATEQEYPLNQAKRFELRQRQQAMNLSDEDIEPIENRITTSIEDRLKKLQQYEQVFSDSIQFEFPVSEATRKELRRFQHVLELRDEEVNQLEEKVTSQNDLNKNQSRQVDNVQELENEPPLVQPQYRVEDPTQVQEMVFSAPTIPSPSNPYHQAPPLVQKLNQKSTRFFLELIRKVLAGSLIVCGSVWTIIFMLLALGILYSPSSGSDRFSSAIFLLLIAGLGLLVAWVGIRWKR